jgi:hypothetical protein
MKLEMRRVDCLIQRSKDVPAPHHISHPSSCNLNVMMDSISKVGLMMPLMIKNSGRIVDGNLRYCALVNLSIETCWCIVTDLEPISKELEEQLLLESVILEPAVLKSDFVRLALQRRKNLLGRNVPFNDPRFTVKMTHATHRELVSQFGINFGNKILGFKIVFEDSYKFVEG